jgi:ABC-type branched-subunit amino acid transport system permease subunit
MAYRAVLSRSHRARSLLFFAYPFLAQSKGALRYILYALILIVLMLLRPQGLLGRGEWSFRRRVSINRR